MDLRGRLTKMGWAQGALIDGHALAPSFPHDLYLIISQTCDIRHKDPDIEPKVELLGLTRLTSSEVKPELKNGRNLREIHFELTEAGNGSQWLHTSMQDICFLDRTCLLDASLKADSVVMPEILADLIKWRANRCLRPAFPDQFEKVLRHQRKSEKLKRKITREKDLIAQIHVAIDPFDELRSDQSYVIDFLLLIEPEIFVDPEARTKLKELSEEIEMLYQKTPQLEELTCRFLPLDKVTLYQLKNVPVARQAPRRHHREHIRQSSPQYSLQLRCEHNRWVDYHLSTSVDDYRKFIVTGCRSSCSPIRMPRSGPTSPSSSGPPVSA